MNCFRVQSLLSAYVDQELTTEDRRLMRTHLFNCQECSEEMESLILIKNLMGRLSAPEIPGDSLSLVHAELHGLINTDNQSNKHAYLDARHLLMTAACISLFLMTSTLIFPRIQNSPQIQAKTKNIQTDQDAIASSRSKEPTSPAETVSVEQQQGNRRNTPELFNRVQISPILSGTPVSR